MNEHVKGISGAATSIGAAVVAWLPIVNTSVQILAGLTAVVAGIFTTRYYHKKTKKL
jgi:membrane protein implicated in regulation of membrane protease activity